MGSDHEDHQMSLTIRATGLVVAISTLCVLLSCYISSLSMKRKLKARPPLPPGSLGLPLLGGTIQFLKHKTGNTLATFFESKQAKYGQTFKMSLMGTPTVIMEPPTGNKFLFANEGKLLKLSWPQSLNALFGPDSLATKTGEEHRAARRHFTQFLSSAAVGSNLPLIERKALEHLEAFWQPPAGGRGDQSFTLSAIKLTKLFTFNLIVGLCIGLDGQVQSEPDNLVSEVAKLFTVWTGGVFQLPINLPGFAYHRALKARELLVDILRNVIAGRRLELKEGRALQTRDMLSTVLTQPDENGRMSTDGELIDNTLVFLFAGHDTSSSVLAMTIMFLAKYPQVRQHMKEEQKAIAASKRHGDALNNQDLHKMKYTWQVVQESMRLLPAVSGAFREATTDFEFNGFTILKGWKLYWTTHTCHENSRFFANPKEFDPSRFEGGSGSLVPHTYLPFGGGPRMCPGNEFAKMEMLVFLHHLVRKYTWTLVDPDEPIIRNPFPRTPKGTPIKVTKLAQDLV